MEVDANNYDNQSQFGKRKLKKQKKEFNPSFKLNKTKKDTNHKYMIGY